MGKYFQARERGANWLLSQVRPDGSLPEPSLNAHYKLPYALVVAGHPLVARRALDYLNRSFLNAEGDYVEDPSDPASRGGFRCFYVYCDCWIAEAAQRIGRFDVARRTGKFVLAYQDEKTGGFRSDPEGRTIEGEMDLLSTARAGMLSLFLGEMEAAARAGDFLLDATKKQPWPEKAVCLAFDPSGSAITTVPEGKGEGLYMVKTDQPRQLYFYLGYPMAFLARLYQATGEARYLEGARQYFAYHKNCSSDVFSSWPSGKSGWGAAVLHTLTGEEEHGRAAETLADFLLHTQSPDGFWFNARSYARVEDQPPAVTFDVTAEFVVWLSSILQEIP